MATHKMAKGDKLELVAKKYGHADWKTVWNAPENKALAGRRGKPELLQPGDVLHIPMNAKDRAVLTAQAGSIKVQIGAELLLRSALQSEIKRIPKVVAMYDELIVGQAAYSKETLGELSGLLEEMRKDAANVDAWSDGLRVVVGIGKHAGTYAKSRKMQGEALEKLNKELAREVAIDISVNTGSAAAKALAMLKDAADAATASVGILGDSWDKINSPSFWAHTAALMAAEGKSWSEATTTNLGATIQERIDAVSAGAAKQIQMWRQLRDARAARLMVYQGLLKLCEARITGHEQASAKLRSQLE